MEPIPGAPSDNTTLIEVLELYRRCGFDGSFRIDDDAQLCCTTCGLCTPPNELDLIDLRRLEGASDPADMVAVLALRCAACQGKGTVVVPYGPEADAASADVLSAIEA